MLYKSTRGGISGVSFIDTVMMGLASDGGLMVPENFPKIDATKISSWRKLDYNVRICLCV